MTQKIGIGARTKLALLACSLLWLASCGGGGGGGGGSGATAAADTTAPKVATNAGPPTSGAAIVQVNSGTAGVQRSPAVAGLAGGGSVTVWATSFDGIFAQRFAADGSRAGGETRLDSSRPDLLVDQPKVAAFPDGGFLVAWLASLRGHDDWVLQLRRFAADGSLAWSSQGAPTGMQYFDVVGLQNGGFVRIVEGAVDAAGADDTIAIERYGSGGALLDAQVLDSNPTNVGIQRTISAFPLADGRLLVSWLRKNGAATRMVQFTTADGLPQGTPQSPGAVREDFDPSMGAALRDGGFVMLDVVGGPGFGVPLGYRVYAQRYSPVAAPVGPPIAVDDETDIQALGTSCYSAFQASRPCPFPWQAAPSVAGTPDGGFVVSWATSDRRRPGTFVYARQFDAGGLPVTGPVRVSVDETSGYGGTLPLVTPVATGFGITWIDHDADQWGIFATRYPGGALD